MAIIDKRIDDYIANAEPFARPILEHLRALVHKSCPDVVETIKWRMPNFEYAGKILCVMAAFKQHCAFGFRLSPFMSDPHGVMENREDKTGMGGFGKIKSMKDLPSGRILGQYIKEAMALTDQGVKKVAKPKTAKELAMPSEFSLLLKKNKAASEHFRNFSPSKKHEYIEWITEAKTDATRQKRMATALEWIAEGKPRNWKYMKK